MNAAAQTHATDSTAASIFSFQPLTLAHLVILEKLDSPIIDRKAVAPITLADAAVAAYIFSQPTASTFRQVTRDRSAFLEDVSTLANTVPSARIGELIALVRTHLGAFAISPAIINGSRPD